MKKNRIIILIVVLLTLILLVVPFGVALFLYNQYFGIRYETRNYLSYSVEDFEGLNREKYEFLSNKGQRLVGYNYYYEKNDIKGIVILAHGFGSGHNTYMDCANYFAKSGFYAFCYDITGNDESEGKSVRGLPQGVIDLDYAIDFVEKQDEFKELPIFLFGHSWGGYSVTSVLNYHPEVKAVASMAGFNKSSDLIKSQGEEMVGKFVNVLMPYINIYEKVVFGKYSTNTSMNGFEQTNANIMIVHSKDDTVVRPKYGYDQYFEKYKDSERFEFIQYEDKGHQMVFYSYKAIEYINKYDEDCEKYFENIEATSELKEKYFNENIDRKIYTNLLDEDLFDKIVEFYNKSV